MSSLTDAQLLQHVRKMQTQVVSFPILGDYSALTRGQIVRLDENGVLQLAKADSDINAAVYGAIYVADANEALLLFSGKLRLAGHGVTRGRFAYLSQTVAGAVTSVKPSSGIVCRIGISMDGDYIFFKPAGAAPEGGSSLGDMTKSVYDADDDGVVEEADVAGGLTGADLAGANKVWGTDEHGDEGWIDGSSLSESKGAIIVDPGDFNGNGARIIIDGGEGV